MRRFNKNATPVHHLGLEAERLVVAIARGLQRAAEDSSRAQLNQSSPFQHAFGGAMRNLKFELLLEEMQKIPGVVADTTSIPHEYQPVPRILETGALVIPQRARAEDTGVGHASCRVARNSAVVRALQHAEVPRVRLATLFDDSPPGDLMVTPRQQTVLTAWLNCSSRTITEIGLGEARLIAEDANSPLVALEWDSWIDLKPYLAPAGVLQQVPQEVPAASQSRPAFDASADTALSGLRLRPRPQQAPSPEKEVEIKQHHES